MKSLLSLIVTINYWVGGPHKVCPSTHNLMGIFNQRGAGEGGVE